LKDNNIVLKHALLQHTDVEKDTIKHQVSVRYLQEAKDLPKMQPKLTIFTDKLTKYIIGMEKNSNAKMERRKIQVMRSQTSTSQSKENMMAKKI
jgi:hypothetical protein